MYRKSQQPSEESVHHSEVIALLSRAMMPSVYLELGVQHGLTFRRIMESGARVCIGVDPIGPPFVLPMPHLFWAGTSVDFLRVNGKNLQESIDLCFVDSLHEFEYAQEEWRLLKEVIAPNGIVVWHDTYPSHSGKLAFDQCGDVWKMQSVVALEPGWESVTLPVQFGLTIARKGRGVLWMQNNGDNPST